MPTIIDRSLKSAMSFNAVPLSGQRHDEIAINVGKRFQTGVSDAIYGTSR
ncbi:hypothetical protein [Nitrosospira sp. NRS527]|nr:hypothetical protein [Nitrosospira sp. NRS527]